MHCHGNVTMSVWTENKMGNLAVVVCSVWPVQISVGAPVVLTEGFRGFPKSFQVNCIPIPPSYSRYVFQTDSRHAVHNRIYGLLCLKAVFSLSTGAFLIPYLIMLVLAGKPMYFLELAVGQFGGVGPVALWNCCPIAKGEWLQV
jgi:hypothetical protein